MTNSTKLKWALRTTLSQTLLVFFFVQETMLLELFTLGKSTYGPKSGDGANECWCSREVNFRWSSDVWRQNTDASGLENWRFARYVRRYAYPFLSFAVEIICGYGVFYFASMLYCHRVIVKSQFDVKSCLNHFFMILLRFTFLWSENWTFSLRYKMTRR